MIPVLVPRDQLVAANTSYSYEVRAFDARTGALVNSFGTNGIVDLKQGAVFGAGQQIDLETGEIGVHSTPVVVKETIIVG